LAERECEPDLLTVGPTSKATTEITITGFSVDPTWAVGDGGSVANHVSTPQVTTNPADTPVLFSLTGESQGATIDSTTGLVTPGSDDSGLITVRAANAEKPSCYGERMLLIRARPVAVAQSVAVPAGLLPNFYGGNWTHTFNSTGGHLAGVGISETVMTAQPNPFGWSFNIQPGAPNVWTLDANGVMLTPDQYRTETSLFDGRHWLPSPPNPGLPHTGTDQQWYHWWCPLDGIWSEFTGPAGIDVTMALALPEITVTTAAYGLAVVDSYLGSTVLLDDVQVAPASIPADGASTAQVSVTAIPGARQVTWSIQGEDLGCTIDADGIVTAGTGPGQVTVRVADGADATYFREAVLTLTAPSPP
jgi:hypothetical protein